MQIDLFTEESMTFKITNTNGDDAVKIFNTVLKKCRTAAMKKGFNNMFNSEEKEFIKEFTDRILCDETGS
jgi:hypothetical protein